jgi:hypothetical protein
VSSLEPAPAAVVYDINVLVTAAAGGNSPFRSWPSPPPVSGNASADCLGIIVDAAEFALWLSPHIITNIDRILAQLFKWAQPQIDAYLRAIVMAAEHSGGGIVADVPRTVKSSGAAARHRARRQRQASGLRPGLAHAGPLARESLPVRLTRNAAPLCAQPHSSLPIVQWGCTGGCC